MLGDKILSKLIENWGFYVNMWIYLICICDRENLFVKTIKILKLYFRITYSYFVGPL